MQKEGLNLKKRDKALNIFICVLLCLIIVFAAFRVFFAVNYFCVHVDGISMEGTLHDGDYVYALHSSSPRRGDIVVIDTGEIVHGQKKYIIKRVIALPGETVELREGVLYLNGEKVDEPYIDGKHNTPSKAINTFPEITVEEGKMVFMGDNRNDSSDCRHIYESGTAVCKPVEISKTIGVVADWSLPIKGTITAINNFFTA